MAFTKEASYHKVRIYIVFARKMSCQLPNRLWRLRVCMLVERDMSDAIVIRRWTEWVVEGGAWRSELVVGTSVETGTDAPLYDPSALEELILRAMDIRSEARPDRIRIVPIGARALTAVDEVETG
jgi:hypothetical protein